MPVIYRVRFSSESLTQFDQFFMHKDNISQSSYKTKTLTSLPVLICRTTFITHLESSQFLYKENMGGLCSACNEYGYEVFEDIKSLIDGYITNTVDRISKKRLCKKSSNRQVSCNNLHPNICKECESFLEFFDQLQEKLEEEQQEALIDYQN
ncbi:9664_t:CDS:2 [Scutellospora calospora]|uniref:9664_t:CDS:1 n=1 Tax=Scutellospora calospora TaxID=85575 RepID=A0ACA9K522_9GLOM|nr:9664_t:CDS:2 [Scutellospora calospora]